MEPVQKALRGFKSVHVPVALHGDPAYDVSEISEMSKKSGSRAIWKFLLTDGSLGP